MRGYLIVFIGQGGASVMTLLSTLAIIAGAGHGGNGAIVSMMAYVSLIFNLCSFKTSNGIIKFMTEAMTAGDGKRLRLYVKLGFLLDLSAMALSVAVAFVAKGAAMSIMRWPPEYERYLSLLILSLVLNLNGTTTGIIGAYRKYNYMVYAQFFGALFKLGADLAACLFGAPFAVYLAIEVLYSLLVNFLLIYLSLKLLHQDGVGDFWKAPLRMDGPFLKFNLYSNFISTIDLPVGQIYTLFLNRFLGVDVVSIYNMMEKIGSIVNKIGAPLSQLLYPEISIKIAQGDNPAARKLVRDTKLLFAAFYGLMLVVFFATYRLWFPAMVGGSPKPYLLPFLIYLTYICYVNANTSLHSILLAYGLIKPLMLIVLIINIVYLGMLYLLIARFGLLGAVCSLFLQAIAVVESKNVLLRAYQRKHHLF